MHRATIKKEINDQSIKLIEEEIEQLEKRLDEQERLEQEREKELDVTIQNDIREKLDKFQNVASYDAAAQLDNVGQRLENYRRESIHAAHTDVLRLNKIIRDVSRSLGAQWKDVFVYIMAGHPKESIDYEVLRIEKERPFMQAYKAMTRWKDLKGDEIDVGQLIEGLKIWDKQDLAKHVEQILYSDESELLKIQNVGSGIVSGAAGFADVTADQAGAAEAAEGAAPCKPVAAAKASAIVDPLADGSLLRIAKKIGGCWGELATYLGLAEEDVEDIKTNEGMTYQGAFKVLWTWRDRSIDLPIDHVTVLREALKNSKMTDAEALLPAS